MRCCWLRAPRTGGLLNEFRPIGGVRNNLLHPDYDAFPGSAELAIAPLRFAEPVTLEPMPSPNPCIVSNVIASGASDSGDDSQTTDSVASAWLYVFGQFVDHDLDLETSSPNGPQINIVVPPGDPFLPEGSLIKMTCDVESRTTHTVNNTTAGYLDPSQLYGSTPEMAASLRARDGLLKTSHDGEALQNIHDRFVTGDPRVNENPEIAMVSTATPGTASRARQAGRSTITAGWACRSSSADSPEVPLAGRAVYCVLFTGNRLANKDHPMSTLPPCPKCNSEFTYEDGTQLVCPECGHEWSATAAVAAEEGAKVYRDSAGNVLQDGDTVTVIKDLKLKGSGGTLKMGTKVKNIRLVDSDHDIDCKIDGFGAMSLKSEFVKKV